MKKPINVGDRVLFEWVSVSSRVSMRPRTGRIQTMVEITSCALNEVFIGTQVDGPAIHYFSRRQIVKVWRKKKRKSADEIVEELYMEWTNTPGYYGRMAIRKALMMRPPKC